MTVKVLTAPEMYRRPVEESAPYENWLSWLKKVATECMRVAHLTISVAQKFAPVDFWMILILHAMLDISLDDAADRLNKLLWKQYNARRRHKLSPPEYDGTYIRRQRKCPTGDQVRKFRNWLPNWLLKDLNRLIFTRLLDYALENHFITYDIDLLVDTTDQWYYGGDRYPANPFITGGHNGPGTNRKRKHLAIMLRSGTTFLFVGVALIAKKASNAPDILATIDWLLGKGFKIRYLYADRWFPSWELLSQLLPRKVTYVGPFKKTAPVRRLVEAYIKHGGNGKYIIPYAANAPYQKGQPRQPSVPVRLILRSAKGRRLREVRQDYLSGKMTLEECVKEIMVMLTTAAPPKGAKRRQAWATNLCQGYRVRWHIETGFRDLARTAPPSNARTNERQFLMWSTRYWSFNAWQLERARRKRLRGVPKSWRKGPTLRQFGNAMLELEVPV